MEASNNAEERVEITSEIISQATDGYEHRSVLKVANASIVDTGFYVCYHKGNEDNPQVAVKSYIYVEGTKNKIFA